MSVSLTKAYVRTIPVDGMPIVITAVEPWDDTFTFRHPTTNARTLLCTSGTWDDTIAQNIRERLTRA